ncbi:MAG: hypothetical protein NC337_14155 [Roseburia sp.]|nr:hypothetical protein [Roseburia sp.]
MTKFTKYWLGVLAGTLALAAYPIYMGVSVIRDMMARGTVMEADYPKYIIPYAPIAFAVLLTVVLMPLFMRLAGRACVGAASAIAVAAFFVAELLFESKVIVTTTTVTTLESWQMFMCVSLPVQQVRAVDILIGNYSPTFKLHFYMISVVLIVSMVNALYGFGQMVRNGDKTRGKALAVQSVCAALFLGLCILACFTAFFRDGELTVSAVSAVLMGVFFVMLGVTAGVYIGSFLLGRGRAVSVLVPAGAALLATTAMYIGELCLLGGNLYRFGRGVFFQGLGGLILAPVDLLIILLAGGLSAIICHWLNARLV